MTVNFYVKVLKTYINYKLQRYNPFAIFFHITNRCNLKCSKCIIRKFNFRKELTTDEISSIINDASDMGVSYFSITGGEPLLRNDIEKIGQIIKNKNMMASLSTNGCLITEERAKKLVNAFDFIRVSLDGFEQTHDKLRGKGSFRAAYNGIRHLTSIPDRNARIGIISVISENNYKKVREFFDAFKDEVDFITFQPAHEIDNVFSNLEFSQSWEKICKSGEKLGDLEEFIANPALERGKKYCDAAKLYLIINPEGNVYPCLIERGNMIGNLRKKSLKDIWNSNEIVEAREKTKDCIGCYSKCTTEISTIFRMGPFEILKKIPNIKRTYRL